MPGTQICASPTCLSNSPPGSEKVLRDPSRPAGTELRQLASVSLPSQHATLQTAGLAIPAPSDLPG